MSDYFGKDTPKLGFGLMRLPETDGEIDMAEVCRMVDLYMASGMNYFELFIRFLKPKTTYRYFPTA